MKKSGLLLIFLFAVNGCGDSVEVDVANPNTQVSIITQPDTLTINREKSITINPLANDSVSQNKSLKIKSVSDHPSLKIEILDKTQLKITPLSYQANEFTLSYIAEVENGPIAEGRIQVTIKNGVPVLLVKDLATLSGLPKQVNLAGQTSDPDGDSFMLEVVETTRPSGTLRIENNVINYNPEIDYFGTDEFKIKATDNFGATAVYPIKVKVTPGQISLNFLDSPANKTNEFGFHITSETRNNQYMGNAVSGYGDVNADGFDDLLISSYSSGAGDPKIWMLLGAKDKTKHLVSSDLFQNSGKYNSRVIIFNQAAFPLYDFDLDGIDDFITSTGVILYGSPSIPKFISPQTVDTYTGKKTQLKFNGLNPNQVTPLIGDYIGSLSFPHYQSEPDNFSMFVHSYSDKRPYIAISNQNGAQVEKFLVPINEKIGLGIADINPSNSIQINTSDFDDFARTKAAYRIGLLTSNAAFFSRKNESIFIGNELIGIVSGLKNISEINDINGDGFSELAFGTTNKLYIKFGEPITVWINYRIYIDEIKNLLSGITEVSGKKIGMIIEQNGIERQWLTRVEGIGDLNADGIGDLAIRGHGHPDYPSNLRIPKDYLIRISNSSLYILWGDKNLGGTINLDTIDFVNQQKITRINGFYRDSEIIANDGISDGTGLTFSGSSDFNGDGYSDIAIGSPEYSTHRSISNQTGTQVGRVSILYGGPHWRGE